MEANVDTAKARQNGTASRKGMFELPIWADSRAPYNVLSTEYEVHRAVTSLETTANRIMHVEKGLDDASHLIPG
jgi:hypothetical protein